MQDTVYIINYLNGINFIMRAKGKFKEVDDLIYTTYSKRKRPDKQATVVRMVAIEGKNELLVFATNTEAKSYKKDVQKEVGYRDFVQGDKSVFAKDDVKALQLKEALLLPCSSFIQYMGFYELQKGKSNSSAC